jgi:integrase
MIIEKNKTVIEEYLLWYSDNGGPSTETQRSARNAIRVFLEFYGEKELKDIEKSDITNYFIYLKTAKYQPRKKGSVPKQYSPQSQFQLKAMLRGFLRWFAQEYGVQDLSIGIKLKPVKQERINSEQITYEDCQKLIEVCQNQRDRAMVAFLLDGGVRRGELLKIRYSDVKFENDGVIVYVPKAKTSPRRVYCVWCTQEMYHWSMQHPLKKPDSYFFCSNRPPHGQLSKNGFGEQLNKIGVRAGMPEIHAHLFRHSSATIFAAIKGMTDQNLKYRFGWTPSSKMADVYVHLSGVESDDNIRQAFGRPIVQKKVAGKVMITCPRCRMDNYADANRCYNCQQALSESEIAKEKALEEEREAAREAAIIEKVEKKLLEGLALNEEKKIEFTRDFDDEQIDELAKLDAEYPEYRPRESGLRDLGVPPESIPEKEENIIKKILKSDNEADNKES